MKEFALEPARLAATLETLRVKIEQAGRQRGAALAELNGFISPSGEETRGLAWELERLRLTAMIKLAHSEADDRGRAPAKDLLAAMVEAHLLDEYADLHARVGLLESTEKILAAKLRRLEVEMSAVQSQIKACG